MFDNELVPRSRTKTIGASAHAATCRKQAAVSCLAVGCDWSDDSHANVHTADATVSHLDTVSRHTFNKTIWSY